MCLLCGNVGDVSGFNAFASFALGVSPLFGIATVKFFRFTSIPRLSLKSNWPLRIGLVIAGYNSLLLIGWGMVFTLFLNVQFMHWPLFSIALISFVMMWWHCFNKLNKHGQHSTLLETYLLCSIAALPFFTTLALFAWQIEVHMEYLYIPYLFKQNQIDFFYQFGIFFQLGLAAAFFSLCLVRLQASPAIAR